MPRKERVDLPNTVDGRRHPPARKETSTATHSWGLHPTLAERIAGALAVLAILTSLPAQACTTPVFRYALERFDVDPFEFVVFHRGPLAVSEKAAVDALEKLSGDAESTLSLRVRLIDLAAPASSGEKPEGIPPRDAKLPWLVVVTAHGELTSPVWSGSLGEADLRALVDSPVRRVLAKRLLAGDAAVFVLLESGKKEPDGQAAKLLQTTLAGLEKTLRLPSDDDGQEQPPDEKAARGEVVDRQVFLDRSAGQDHVFDAPNRPRRSGRALPGQAAAGALRQ